MKRKEEIRSGPDNGGGSSGKCLSQTAGGGRDRPLAIKEFCGILGGKMCMQGNDKNYQPGANVMKEGGIGLGEG